MAVGKATFHLHQVVHIPRYEETYTPSEWVVIGLEESLLLADTQFNTTLQYTRDDLQQEVVKPQTAATGVPIFGY